MAISIRDFTWSSDGTSITAFLFRAAKMPGRGTPYNYQECAMVSREGPHWRAIFYPPGEQPRGVGVFPSCEAAQVVVLVELAAWLDSGGAEQWERIRP